MTSQDAEIGGRPNAVPDGEARYRALLAGMLDPVVTIDMHGIVQDASDSVERVFGYRPDELVGQNINILMPEPHRSSHDSYLAKYRETGETWILNTTREFDIVCKDGSIRGCELSVSRVDLPGEASPAFCGSFRDISDRRRAQDAQRESELRLRAIFDQEFQFVGLLDPDGTVLEVNRAALEAAGLEYDEAVGLPFWQSRWWGDAQEERDRCRQAVQRARTGEFVRYQARFQARGGERTIDFSLKPVRDESGEVILLIPEGRDITDLQRAQDRETAMLRSLATIGESAAVLAHEIKNPITAINIALRAVADQLGEDHAAVLEDLASRMRNLESIMRRTLSFAKPLDLRRTNADLIRLVRSCVQLLAAECGARRVSIVFEEPRDPLSYELDEALMEEVIVNLIKNAIEAVEDGGRILVRIQSDDSGVTISVADSGPGLSASARDSLFRPFSTSKQAGTGLGLAICKKIVEAHGGIIDANARCALGGAEFFVRLGAGARDASTSVDS